VRVLVCGSRNLTAAHLPEVLRWMRKAYRPGFVLIHGDGPPGDVPGAIGADKLAEAALAIIAPEALARVQRYPADWKRLGRSAGPKRNIRMVEDSRPEGWLAFPLQGQANRGTFHTVGLLRAADVLGRAVVLGTAP
jgi:hypothetical protein